MAALSRARALRAIAICGWSLIAGACPIRCLGAIYVENERFDLGRSGNGSLLRRVQVDTTFVQSRRFYSELAHNSAPQRTLCYIVWRSVRVFQRKIQNMVCHLSNNGIGKTLNTTQGPRPPAHAKAHVWHGSLYGALISMSGTWHAAPGYEWTHAPRWAQCRMWGWAKIYGSAQAPVQAARFFSSLLVLKP